MCKARVKQVQSRCETGAKQVQIMCEAGAKQVQSRCKAGVKPLKLDPRGPVPAIARRENGKEVDSKRVYNRRGTGAKQVCKTSVKLVQNRPEKGDAP